MKRTIALTSALLSLSMASPAISAEDHHSHGGHGVKEEVPAEMALKHEMKLLDAAFKNLLDAILLDRPEIIEAPFHEVHMAKMETEKALHSGKAKPPKNADKLEEFVEMDEAFHDKLRKLLGAAGKKDREGIKASAHEILDGCVQCHNMFRN